MRVGAAILALAVAVEVAAAPAVVPPVLHDVTGAEVDVAALAARGRLVFVTVKAAWCPVCRTQLARLGRLLPRLRACGATFVVLVPGAPDAVAALARETRFPYPFVAEGAAAVAAVAGFGPSVPAEDASVELLPGFFTIDAARAVDWRQRGRGAGAYGDRELMTELGCGAEGDLLAGRPGEDGSASASLTGERRGGASRRRSS